MFWVGGVIQRILDAKKLNFPIINENYSSLLRSVDLCTTIDDHMLVMRPLHS